jgi:poly(3-hydroxybutyrate) depolymerase
MNGGFRGLVVVGYRRSVQDREDRISVARAWLVLAALVIGCEAGNGTATGALAAGAAAAGTGGVAVATGASGTAGNAGASGMSGAGDSGGAAHGAGAGAGGAGGAAGGAGSSGDGGTGAPGGGDGDSAAALAALREYLDEARADRAPIAEQPFASVPLTRAHAEEAAELLWSDHAAMVRATRATEVGATESQAATVQVDGSTLRYYMAERGADPPGGRSLFISMHGGGNAPAATNDSQWENQIALVSGYMPVDALWVAPRAPIDDWNMWFVPEIDRLFDRLISNLIVFEGIDPNKVYISGYSAGGDGVYQLGPRMADRWAGAAMSAGHPNDASPLNLRNLAFAIHVGGDDSAYDRNLVAAEWGAMLEQLAAQDEGGYPNQWQVHDGLPHWMDLADAVAIPFVQMFTRNPVPPKVVWRQANVTQSRFYWLAVDAANEQQGAQISAAYAGSTIALSDVTGLQGVTVRFSDAMMDLDQPVRIELAGNELFAGSVARTIGVLARTLEERGDPALMFSGEVAVELP